MPNSSPQPLRIEAISSVSDHARFRPCGAERAVPLAVRAEYGLQHGDRPAQVAERTGVGKRPSDIVNSHTAIRPDPTDTLTGIRRPGRSR